MAGSARVFISYSSKDTGIIDRLKNALASAGIDVWLDHERLTPGTPNWQVAVHNGIKQATHVVYAASETAALSPYVIQEIEMAKGEGKMVLPFWIQGEKWYDCTPMGWYPAQYMDGRGSTFVTGLTTLLAALTVHADQAPNAAPSVPPVQSVAGQSPKYPLPDMPKQLVELGFRGVNVTGMPAIIPPLISIPAGAFLLGSDKRQDPQALSNELPQHRVELGAYQIAKYPVTVAEYAVAVRATAVKAPGTWRPPDPDKTKQEPLFYSGSRENPDSQISSAWPKHAITWNVQLQHPDHPVVCVSFRDALSYVEWLRKETGQTGWRLPSEAEWEKAARWDAAHATCRTYPWGNTFDRARCNTAESGVGATISVGAFPANTPRSGASPYGVEEMVGNVWEVTISDSLKGYPYRASDGRERVGWFSTFRSMRGGSFISSSDRARGASRGKFEQTAGRFDAGFRLALS